MSFWSFFMRDTYPSRLVRLAPLVEVVKRISFASRCLHRSPQHLHHQLCLQHRFPVGSRIRL